MYWMTFYATHLESHPMSSNILTVKENVCVYCGGGSLWGFLLTLSIALAETRGEARQWNLPAYHCSFVQWDVAMAKTDRVTPVAWFATCNVLNKEGGVQGLTSAEPWLKLGPLGIGVSSESHACKTHRWLLLCYKAHTHHAYVPRKTIYQLLTIKSVADPELGCLR